MVTDDDDDDDDDDMVSNGITIPYYVCNVAVCILYKCL